MERVKRGRGRALARRRAPDCVAIRPDDHRAPHRPVVSQLGVAHNVQVPPWVSGWHVRRRRRDAIPSRARREKSTDLGVTAASTAFGCGCCLAPLALGGAGADASASAREHPRDGARGEAQLRHRSLHQPSDGRCFARQRTGGARGTPFWLSSASPRTRACHPSASDTRQRVLLLKQHAQTLGKLGNYSRGGGGRGHFQKIKKCEACRDCRLRILSPGDKLVTTDRFSLCSSHPSISIHFFLSFPERERILLARPRRKTLLC